MHSVFNTFSQTPSRGEEKERHIQNSFLVRLFAFFLILTIYCTSGGRTQDKSLAQTLLTLKQSRWLRMSIQLLRILRTYFKSQKGGQRCLYCD